MDILAKARKLETQLARTVDRAASKVLPSREREPLEIVHAVLESIDREVQPAGRGRHLFPFNRMRVWVLAPSRQAQARFEAVFASEPTLAQRIASRLEGAGCPVPDLALTVECAETRGEGWMAADVHVEFDRVQAPVPEAPEPAAEPPSIAFAVVAGTGVAPVYALQLAHIEIGRCAEVRDPRHRLLRTNHVAFADDPEPINQTVSRRHAHVDFVSGTGEFRVYDDGSEQGTSVARSGRTIAVPPGARGVRLHSGDEILLGQARVRVTFDR